eukprot:scaffold6230_cov69-Phaeocystis_antarctica.AAC.2
MPVHCIAARQHTKVVATVRGSCPPCARPSALVAPSCASRMAEREPAAAWAATCTPELGCCGIHTKMSKRHAWVTGCWRRLSTFLERAATGVTSTIVAQSAAARPAFTPSYSRKRAKVTTGRLVANSGLGRALAGRPALRRGRLGRIRARAPRLVVECDSTGPSRARRPTRTPADPARASRPRQLTSAHWPSGRRPACSPCSCRRARSSHLPLSAASSRVSRSCRTASTCRASDGVRGRFARPYGGISNW